MNREVYAMLVIAVCAIITFLLRAAPFLLFRGREVPASVTYLGRALPTAIMAALVIYCMKDVSFAAPGGWAPRFIACGVTVALHLWKHNTLLSIFGGTAVCMVLTQLVFL